MRGNNAASVNVAIGAFFAGNFKSTFGDADRRIGQLGQTIRNLERHQRDAAASIKEFGRAGHSVDAVRKIYAKVTDQIKAQRSELDRLIAAEAKRKNNLQARSEAAGALGRTAAGATVAAIPVVGSALAAADYQYQLQLIGNTAGMSAAEIANLGKQMELAGRLTFQSADETAKAMGFLIAAGLDVQTAQQSLVAIGRTATASGADIEDMAKAAFVLTDTLKIAPGQALQDALDTLATAGKEGNVELKDMAKVLPVLGSGFQALKMGGREAAATMGAALEIARKGAGSADEAANNLQNFLAKVASPETLKKAEEKFGLDLYKVITDAQKKGGNPFEAAIQAVSQATGGDQKKIGELFGDMQVQNFIRPMIQNLEEYQRIKEKALSARGVTDKDFAVLAEQAKLQLKGIADEGDRAYKAVGASLAPAFGAVAAAITPAIAGMTDFVNANPALVGGVIATVAGLTGLRLGLLAARLGWTFLVPALTAVTGPLLFIGRTVLPLLGTAFMALSRMLLMNPIGLTLTALGAAAYLLYTHWDTAFQKIKAAVEPVLNWLAEKMQWVTDSIARVGAVANRVGAFIGITDGPVAGSASPTAAGAVPAMPGGGNVSASSSTSAPINIYGATDPKATAAEVRRQLEERDRRADAARRSALVDALGY